MTSFTIGVVGRDADSIATFESVREAAGGEPTGEPPAPGATLMVAWRGDVPVARLALSLVHDLHQAPGPSGLVGHYEAVDPEGGVTLLRDACSTLARQGAVRVLGPMNGSTWARYRLALRDDPSRDMEAPPFLTEPWNPPGYPGHFEAAEFSVAARYESRVDLRLDAEAEDADTLEARVRHAGIQVRTLDLAAFDQELDRLFALSLECFAHNLYYTPIDLATFRAQYEKIRPLIDPDLVLIANTESRPVAFQFAFRDPLSPDPRAPRVIVKTVATSPACRGLGLGGHMLDLIRRRARALGAGSVIHALMYSRNLSMRMSARHETEVFRRYALYQWTP